jgi:hypothetical protein
LSADNIPQDQVQTYFNYPKGSETEFHKYSTDLVTSVDVACLFSGAFDISSCALAFCLYLIFLDYLFAIGCAPVAVSFVLLMSCLQPAR